MADIAPRRVSVFDRIDANRRNTVVLSAICVVALIPVVGWLSGCLPIGIIMLLPGLTDFAGASRIGIPVQIGMAVIIAPATLVGAM